MDNLKKSFGKRKILEKTKTTLVQDVFSRVSNKYDLMNDIMSLGTHRLWKKKLIDIMQIQNNDTILDMGSGTGDLVDLILKKNLNSYIYAVDLNLKMLNINKKRFSKKQKNKIKFLNANAEDLPIENNFVDKYVISFCLRNITYIELALKEAERILKPGGIFYCLEFSMPSTNIVNSIYSKYKKDIIPYLGEKIANSKHAYRYLEESISNFPNQDILKKQLIKIGFENVTYTNLFNGIVCIHRGFKI